MTSTTDWAARLERTSFIELDARARAAALLDDGAAYELCGPFDRIESPWLEPQGVVPQSDDGVVVVKGRLGGRPAVVIAIEQAFQGGGIGEVSGVKIATALSLAARDSRAGTTTAAVLLLETGGVRLQEANLGLATVAEVCSALLELRALAPVVGVIAGALGCFGGMSIAAGLCTKLIMTEEGRLGLDGPAVIESEAGVAEFDASDHPLIWSITGGRKRTRTGLADELVADDVATLRSAVIGAVAQGVPAEHRSQRIGELRAHIEAARPSEPPDLAAAGGPPMTRGRAWTQALADGGVNGGVPSVISADVTLGEDLARILTVVPDPHSPYHRARRGEVGLREGLALASEVTGTVAEDAHLPDERRRPIIALVDLPSQAYGRVEETFGIHQALAAAVDAYATARAAGHPVIVLIVGTALSGGLLAHGFQANQVLALDDPGVLIHAMHKEAAAKVTLRTVAELDELAGRILPLSYDVTDWARLGLCDELLTVENADVPTERDVGRAKDALTAAVARARRGPRDLSNRLDSPGARRTRTASRRVREALTAQWG
ncbi:biotin-independent malonate decarboxylase subunit beta [Nonomuraea jiangxiensis]|uniref:Malonate decarboxylase beta subunit n=1 Tax=Nonomuraea jiangxiensis TaxID=633440 RepID=A0A1G8TH72_9ACTN|nr:biotin-independent malonate decarboxylase subunit beta [Nonomuraea jiangxiensis]SDJ40841.1 malonate decarboxylase beta subunit [Nonomuraea jiangxiensis]